MAGRAAVHFLGNGTPDPQLVGALAARGFEVQLVGSSEAAGLDLVLLDGRGLMEPALVDAVTSAALQRPPRLLVMAAAEVSADRLLEAGADDLVRVPAGLTGETAASLLDARLAVLARGLRGGQSTTALAPAPGSAAIDAAFLLDVLNTVADPVFVKDDQHRWIVLNTACCRFMGYPLEALLGKSDFDFFPADEARVFWAQDERVLASGMPHENEESFTDASGTTHTIATKKAVLQRPDGHKILVGVIRDITARQQAETALRQSERRFRTLVESNIIGTVLMKGQGQIGEANDAFLRMIGQGRSELDAGRLDWQALTPPEQHRADERAQLELARTGASAPYEKTLLRSDGRRVPVVVCLSLLEGLEGQVLGFILDDSERCRMEEQLRQSQKLEAIGRLAGGVAHDFNNILTSILGTSELLLETVPRSSPVHRKMDLIHRSAVRAARLISQLLAFGRKQVLQPKLLDLNIVVGELITMLGPLIGDNIELLPMLRRQPLAVKVDPGQLEQVLVNLVVNARDAMPQGGQLRVCTDQVVIDESGAAARGAPVAGAYARLTVEDTGCGMNPEVLANIFEPFFSTKGPGQGTGLGLATVYGIVSQSGGFIGVTSRPDQGSRFEIHLPELDSGALPAPPPMAALPRRPRGHETVLVVEDDPDVQQLIRTVLEDDGYTVLVAGDGQRALELSEAHAGPIDLLLTDLVLPRMGGAQVAERLMAARPSLRVLYCSGYPGPAPDRQLLVKPLSPRVLARTVRAALDGHRPPRHRAASRR